MWRSQVVLCLLLCFSLTTASGRQGEAVKQRDVLHRFVEQGLRKGLAYNLLSELTRKAPHRLSGSTGAAKAVEVTTDMLRRIGCDSVWNEPCMVPHWERGPVETVELIRSGIHRGPRSLSACALGGSIGTPKSGIEGEVIEVKSLEEAASLGERATGKIVFYNRAMDPGKLSTFEAYGGAVDQRSTGASVAARVGAVAVLVRSMTRAEDDVPHTGTLTYLKDAPKIPAAALSTKAAETLSRALTLDPRARVKIKLSCRMLPDVPSANVVGEIRGSEKPGEIIVVGGHLDCWDKGMGAHDDGSGCVHAIEILNLFRTLHIAPRRTIRAVLFMNEENGSRGGEAYRVAPGRKTERTYAAIESDRGGFAPRGFTVQADSITFDRILLWKPFFEELAAGRIIKGGSGSDVEPIVESGAIGFGLDVRDERYFDVHHSDNDTIGSVHPRELELGAIATAFLCYLLSEYGLPE
jgi:carboxypeptidase Q